MSIKNRVIAFLYRLGASCISIGALIYDFGFFSGEIKVVNFLYFTIISNIFCCGLFITLTIKTLMDIKRDGIYGTSSISPHIKGEILISILLTMIVYHFILIPYALKINPYQSLKATDIIGIVRFQIKIGFCLMKRSNFHGMILLFGRLVHICI